MKGIMQELEEHGDLPSGKRLQFAIENGHRNSGFSH